MLPLAPRKGTSLETRDFFQILKRADAAPLVAYVREHADGLTFADVVTTPALTTAIDDRHESSHLRRDGFAMLGGAASREACALIGAAIRRVGQPQTDDQTRIDPALAVIADDYLLADHPARRRR